MSVYSFTVFPYYLYILQSLISAAAQQFLESLKSPPPPWNISPTPTACAGSELKEIKFKHVIILVNLGRSENYLSAPNAMMHTRELQ